MASNNDQTMQKRRPWYSFEGLSEGQKKAKARTGLVLALVFFILMNAIILLR